MIYVPCESCGKVLQAPEEHAGREAACPGCHRRVSVPTEELAEDELADRVEKARHGAAAEVVPGGGKKMGRLAALAPRKREAKSLAKYGGPVLAIAAVALVSVWMLTPADDGGDGPSSTGGTKPSDGPAAATAGKSESSGAASARAGTVGVAPEVVEGSRIRVAGCTSLPPETRLVVSVRGQEDLDFQREIDCKVRGDGTFATSPVGGPDGLPPGPYTVGVRIAQPTAVQPALQTSGAPASKALAKVKSEDETAWTTASVTVPDQPSAEEPDSTPDHEVIRERTYANVTRSLTVRLTRRVTKRKLRSLAEKLWAEAPSYRRTLIEYRLPGMTPGGGAWATTHFTPELKVSVLGATAAQYKRLRRVGERERSSGETLGVWICEEPHLSHRITIYRKGETYRLRRVFEEGSSATAKLVERSSPYGRAFAVADSEGGGQYVIAEGGELQIRDDGGLVATARPLPAQGVDEKRRAGSPAPSPGQLFGAVAPSVVKVTAGEDSGRLATGAGFFAAADGKVVTTRHIIDGASHATVEMHDGRRYRVTAVLGVHPKQDLALLATEAEGVSPLTLAEGSPSVGSTVFAISSPEGITKGMSKGLVSGLRQKSEIAPDVSEENDGKVLQTTASIGAGSTGGPLVTPGEKVVGVAIGTLDDLHLAVPASAARELLGEGADGAERELGKPPEEEASATASVSLDLPSVELPSRGSADRRLRRMARTLRSGCSRCDGDGKVKVKVQTGTKEVGSLEIPIMEIKEKRCEDCGGRGAVIATARRFKKWVRNIAKAIGLRPTTSAAAMRNLDQAVTSQSLSYLSENAGEMNRHSIHNALEQRVRPKQPMGGVGDYVGTLDIDGEGVAVVATSECIVLLPQPRHVGPAKGDSSIFGGWLAGRVRPDTEEAGALREALRGMMGAGTSPSSDDVPPVNKRIPVLQNGFLFGKK